MLDSARSLHKRGEEGREPATAAALPASHRVGKKGGGYSQEEDSYQMKAWASYHIVPLF